MVEETNTEQVENLALVPASTPPDPGHGLDRRIRPGQTALQTQPLLALNAVQMVDNLQARLRGIPVYCRHRAQANELLVVFEKTANAGDLSRSYLQRQFAAFEL